jgi:hypothetical protein
MARYEVQNIYIKARFIADVEDEFLRRTSGSAEA